MGKTGEGLLLDDDATIAPLLRLMSVRRKGKLKRDCRSLLIRKQDFAKLIISAQAGMLPWQHQISSPDFVPEHLNPATLHVPCNGDSTEKERLDSFAQSAIGKIAQSFKERRFLVGHMFYTPELSNWHFYYFDQRDTDPHGNHWCGGPHIHFINYLWPGKTAGDVWARFNEGNVQMAGALHIRYLDDRRAR